MNYPYPGPSYTPSYIPPTPQQSESRDLRRVASFIGFLMLALTVSMQFTYPLIVLVLTATGILTQGAAVQVQLGLDNTTFMCIYALVYTLAMGSPLLLVLGNRRLFSYKPPRENVSGGISFLAILGAVGGCMGANIVTSILMTLLENWNVPIPEMPDMMEPTPISLLLNLLVIAVLPALLEEAVFRGCVLRALRPYGDCFAVVVSAVLFGLMHGNIRQIPFAVIVGLILGWLYVTTNSIALPILVHFINNALSVCMEYLAFGMDDTRISVFYGGIIYGLTVLGAIMAIILLFVRGTQLRMQPSATLLPVGEKISALFKSPTFVISIIVFIGLIGLELML